MNRRSLLAGAGCSVTAVLGGCLEGVGDGETDDKESDSGSQSQHTDDVLEEQPRVTAPTHEIDRPEPPDDPGDPEQRAEWNDEYLGERMPTSPSLAHETIPVSVEWVREAGYGAMDHVNGSVYRARTVTDRDEYEAVFDDDAMDEAICDRLQTVEFDDSMLVLVESGFGSGSVDHRWARVENDEAGVHLHGYYTAPYEQTSDLTARFSVLEVERPADDADIARVSLTVRKNRTVHFNSTEGLVGLEE